jgi:hypothetical protein
MDGWDLRIMVVASATSIASVAFGLTWQLLLLRGLKSRVVQISLCIAVAAAVFAIAWRILGPLLVGLDGVAPGSLRR